MFTYCQQSAEVNVTHGEFTEACITLLSNQHFHEHPDFMQELAELIMSRYESIQAPRRRTRMLSQQLTQEPSRTRQFYHRLFDADGTHTLDFETEASETLAWWLEDTSDDTTYSKRFAPHNKIPAIDVLSVVADGETQVLRMVQVKATEGNLQSQSSEAVSKFEKLYKGRYDADIEALLEVIENDRSIPPSVRIDELRSNNRRYRVTAIHGQERQGLRMMTLFAQKVLGGYEVRSVRLIEVQWADFWSHLARIVYAELR